MNLNPFVIHISDYKIKSDKMKYLKYELCEKVCAPGGEKLQDEWNEQYRKYLAEFDSISSRLPKGFLKEFGKNRFHDNIIEHISVNRIKLKNRCKYVLTMDLLEYSDESIVHKLIFSDVRNLKSNLDFTSIAGYFDWIYCEILPVDEKHLSLEAVLFDDSMLYFEFSKMNYKKIKNNLINKQN